jgi:4a-hydroxytetrahydrobiopterin dehydratase
MPQAFTKAERDQALLALPEWTYAEDRNALHRKLVLEDFSAALGLMVRIGIEAEKADHHPEWFNVYNKLEIWLTTHDAGGVSEKDIALAEAIDRLARR